jgi:hypothetical protein
MEIGGRLDVDYHVLTSESVKTKSGCGFAGGKSTMDGVDTG